MHDGADRATVHVRAVGGRRFAGGAGPGGSWSSGGVGHWPDATHARRGVPDQAAARIASHVQAIERRAEVVAARCRR